MRRVKLLLLFLTLTFGSAFGQDWNAVVEDAKGILGIPDSVEVVLQMEDLNRFSVNGNVVRGRASGYGKGYRIRVHNKMTTTQTYRVIAHEMIHVWQFWSKNVEVSGHDVLFYGRKVYHWEDKPYRARPWEKEAYAREKGLARQLQGID